MVSKSLITGILATALATIPASAATGQAQLTSTNGKVLVNQGTGFVQPTGRVFLKTGDRIFVGHKASAMVTYLSDNCRVSVPADRVVTIQILSPCQDKAVQIQPAADLPEEIPE